MRTAAFLGLGLSLAFCAAAGPVAAQALGPVEIGACLCLRRAVDALGAETAAKQQGLGEVRAELDQVTAELEAVRTHMDVNDPQQVARFRQMLERRDALFHRASGDSVAEAGGAVERFNQRSQEYNTRCANRPMDPGLVERAQATLACPAP